MIIFLRDFFCVNVKLYIEIEILGVYSLIGLNGVGSYI